MKVWKVLGVAGLAGVAATGVVVARAERRRRAYEPDDVRARLHERYQEVACVEPAPSSSPGDATGGPDGVRARRGCAGLRKRGRRRR